MTEKGSNNKDRKKRGEKIREEKENDAIQWLYDMDSEMIRWMTDETNTNMIPRSDAG
jgi:hypothetical protein